MPDALTSKAVEFVIPGNTPRSVSVKVAAAAGVVNPTPATTATSADAAGPAVEPFTQPQVADTQADQRVQRDDHREGGGDSHPDPERVLVEYEPADPAHRDQVHVPVAEHHPQALLQVGGGELGQAG